jgi:hypothetical protein
MSSSAADYDSSSSAVAAATTTSAQHEMVLGPLGIDPATFGLVGATLLLLFVAYLVLPRGARVEYFGAYPKRFAWSSRTKAVRDRIRYGGGGGALGGASISSVPADARSIGISTLDGGASSYAGVPQHGQYNHHNQSQSQNQTHRQLGIGPAGAGAGAGGSYSSGSFHRSSGQYSGSGGSGPAPAFDARAGGSNRNLIDLSPNDEIVISAAMQQLRDPGVLVVAHGSKGKPKTVRLRLVESAISWRTETQRKKASQSGEMGPKLGKLHHVPLAHILYVDVGKQTTALRRVENASVMEDLCFSLLTKEGSLDLECNSAQERDALVSCFSMVLDEVHASNWRDVQRVPSSDMPSSFDGGDGEV